MITMGTFLNDYKNGELLGPSIDFFISQNPNHQMALAIKKMHQTMDNTKYFDDAILLVNQIDYQKYAVEEQLVFLHFLCHIYILVKRTNSAKSTLSVIKSLTSNQLPPEWQIIPIELEGILQRVEGNYKGKTDSLEKCLQILGPKSGRYKIVYWVYLIHLCFVNEFDKIEVGLKEYERSIKNTNLIGRVDYIVLLRNIEMGNLQSIPVLVKKIRDDESLKLCEPGLIPSEKLYQIFVKNNYEVLDEQIDFDWIFLSTMYILKNEPEKALYWAHKYAEEQIDFKMGSNSTSYFLIRAELANKNTSAAEYSLENRKRIGNTCVIDDYFRFRINHIKGNSKEAQYYFNLFFYNVEKYKLDGRFDFEIKLSPEISFTDIRNYTRNLKVPLLPNIASTILNENKNDEASSNFIIGESNGIKQVKSLIKKYSMIDTTVLIIGETGTGKELVAKALWQSKNYRGKPYIPINCGAISDQLLQSELFGHVKGAFTGAFKDHKGVFEAAEDGIVFLDEIGEISSVMQVSLLRILEAKEYRPVGSNESKKLKCKIIAATNRDLIEHVKIGKFRQDLLYRLEKLTIEIPPLRERATDIPILVDHFLNTENSHLPNIHFDETALQFISSLPWQGNIRELRNEMERVRLFYSDLKILTIKELSNKYKAKDPIKNINIKPNIRLPIIANINAKSKFRKIEELKNLFSAHNKLTRVEVAEFLKISPNTAQAYLNILEEENFIRKANLPLTKSFYYQKTDTT